MVVRVNTDCNADIDTHEWMVFTEMKWSYLRKVLVLVLLGGIASHCEFGEDSAESSAVLGLAGAAVAIGGASTPETADGTTQTDSSSDGASDSTYSIGGTITGLSGNGLTLTNQGGDDLVVSSESSTFTFSTKLSPGSTYEVRVKSHPSGTIQHCSVSNGSGTVGDQDVTGVAIECKNGYTVGGTLTGLISSSITLQNNSSESLTLSANGSFVFTVPVVNNESYHITIKTAPSDAGCQISSGSGTENGSNVSDVVVSCPVAIVNGLKWNRCTHGQIWKPTTGDCTGTGASSEYGATTVTYCGTPSSDCDDGTSLTSASSQAFAACEALNTANSGAGTYGIKTWRVPAKDELKGIVHCSNGKTTPLADGEMCEAGLTQPAVQASLFPNTQAMSYWATTPVGFSNAWIVQFANGSTYTDNLKTFSNYVRCVSN